MTTYAAPIYTTIAYFFRDDGNYKEWEEVTLEGTLTDEQKQRVRESLATLHELNDSFTPATIGWPLAITASNETDLHELDLVAGISRVRAQSRIPALGTVDDWVAAMVAVGPYGWE